MKFISAVSVNDKENADNGSESDIFSRSHASWQHFVMRFAWPLAITEWSVIYTQSWFTTPKLRWILSMATLSSFSPFLRHLLSLSLSLSLSFCFRCMHTRRRQRQRMPTRFIAQHHCLDV